MHTLRVRPFMYFAAGIAVTVAAAWSLSAWRASAAVSADESTFVPVTPARILDTRSDLGLAGPFVSADPQDLQVTGAVATPDGSAVVVPAGATGVTLNVTAVGPTADGFVTVRPADAPGLPTTSNLNFKAGDIIPNAVTVQMPTSGADAGRIEITFDAFGQAGPTTEILVDVVGYTKNAGLASLQAQVNALQTQVEQLNAAGASVVFDGDPAGNGLSGTYPNPGLAANSVGASQVADNSLTATDLGPNSVGASELLDHSVGLTEMKASVHSEVLLQSDVDVADNTCGPDITIAAQDAVAGSVTLVFLNRLNDNTENLGWIVISGVAPAVANDQATVRICKNFIGGLGNPPDLRIGFITLGP